MTRRFLAMMAVALGLAMVSPSNGQDLGKIFEKAAKKAVKQAIQPAGGPVPGRAGGALAGEARGEVVPFTTKDGWTLVAHHYPPAAAPKAGAMPVILCHGLTYNASFWDLDPNVSFAAYLSDQGYDVWSIDLRGSGLSQKWVWKLDEAPDMLIGSAIRKLSKGKLAPTGYATADPKFANWSLDHHIAYDVPAAVRFVRRQTNVAGGCLDRPLDGRHHRAGASFQVRQPRNRPACDHRQPGHHARWPASPPVHLRAGPVPPA